jgi:hypothetical protein
MPDNDWPLTVSSFLEQAEFHLRKGDIILSRSPTLTSKLIRLATGSAFSHAAVVFLVRELEEGFENTFLLESTGDGVGIANLRHYISGKRPKAEIVVLRFRDETLGPKFFKHVNGLMLDHVKASYDYSRIVKLALSLMFGLRLGYGKVRRGSSEAMQAAIERTRRRLIKWLPPQFICSGFIQYGLVKAAALEGISPESVVLREGINANNMDELLAVTPDDVSHSSKLKWLFVARKGWVYSAENRERAIELISGGR